MWGDKSAFDRLIRVLQHPAKIRLVAVNAPYFIMNMVALLISDYQSKLTIKRQDSMKNIQYLTTFLLLLLITVSLPSTGAPKKPFKLRDFAGDWVMSTSSVGGVGLNQGPGIASTVLRRVTIDADGHGIDDNGSYTFYMADGSLIHHDDKEGDSITLTLEDPINGAGKLTYVDTNTYKSIQIYDFIATRTKNGAVNKLYLQLVDANGAKVVVSGVAERQQEK